MKEPLWYTVKISYTTGDTFNTYEDSDVIGMCWENEKLAEQAVEEIRKHNEVFTEWGISDSKKKKKASKYPWYNKSNPEFTINLERDDGSRKPVGVFWLGYFEHLYCAEVIVLDE